MSDKFPVRPWECSHPNPRDRWNEAWGWQVCPDCGCVRDVPPHGPKGEWVIPENSPWRR